MSVLGDTGEAPADESTPARPLPYYRHHLRLERQILGSTDPCGIVIRPGLTYGLFQDSVVMKTNHLASHYRRWVYVIPGSNHWSAIHVEDLADLYCRVLNQARAGTMLHAASETFMMRDVASAIHRGLGRIEDIGLRGLTFQVPSRK